MRESLKSLLEKLSVARVLSAYETNPWFHFDEEKGTTCSAEVRMGPDTDELEAEIQIVSEEGDEDGGEGQAGGAEQIFYLRALPAGQEEWSVKAMKVKGEDYVNRFSGWDEKGCKFFSACVNTLQIGELPDFDTLIEEELQEDDQWGGGRRGKIGRKSPKADTAALLNMNKRGI